ncbi:MAG: pilus assembly protein PilP [Bdellovibrionaceae bacterium]|nr:pilus assembly protein PilP [Pseudobdellovibrionaceae bacterium]
MKNLRWTLAAGVVVLLSVITALFLATGTVTRLRAQAPGMDLPPPTNELPPPASEFPPPANELPPPQAVPAQAQPAVPPAPNPDLPPPPSNELPPPSSEFPAGQLSIEGAPALAPPALDASADPGLRTSNPEGFFYDPSGRRDPFMPPRSFQFAPTEAGTGYTGRPATEPHLGQGPGDAADLMVNQDPLLSYYVKDFKLIGVLWDVNDPKAMVRGPNNGVYTIRMKMKMGRESAVVAAIREREIVLVQPDDKGDYSKGETLSIRMK